MKLRTTGSLRQSAGTITRIEVGVIFLCSMLLMGLALAFLGKSRGCDYRETCSMNLKQMALAFRTWAVDAAGYPASTPVRIGGTMELVVTGAVCLSFQVISNELSTPSVLICPQDKERIRARVFTNLSDRNLSYFLNLDAHETSPRGLLCGDRNLTNQSSARSRFINITKDTILGWTKDLHSHRGNIAFADGGVAAFTNGLVAATADMENGETNRLVTP